MLETHTRLTRVVVVLTALLALIVVTACDKDATRDDEKPTSPATSTTAGDGTMKKDDGAKDEEPKKEEAKKEEASKSFDHSKLDGLLKKFVTDKGLVKYKEWKADEASLKELDAYMKSVAEADMSKLEGKELLAFWINGYNAFALKGILNAFPVSSVMKIKGMEDGKFFKEPKWKIGGMELTLDQIENEKIRKDFSEPRIHFVVNCTALSCPIIRRDALTVENMDAIMEQSAKEYINQETKVNAKKKTASASQIFNWFKADFEKDGTVNDYLAKYLEDEAAAKAIKTAKLSFHEYKWDLNEAK